MLKIFLFISLIAFSSGLIYKLSDISDYKSNDLFYNLNEKVVETELPVSFSDDLWVLELDFDRFEHLRLKLGTTEDEEIFDEEIGPIIESYERIQPEQKKYEEKAHHARNVRKILRKMRAPSDAVVRSEIRKIVNKFTLFSLVEPESHLSDGESTPFLTVYFKDKYSAMSVRMGIEQWNYFLRPPSPLPSWFYENHSSEDAMYVDVPENVERDFYLELLDLVRLYLNVPV